jgi:AhpD family alkylhydroperoxidase
VYAQLVRSFSGRVTWFNRKPARHPGRSVACVESQTAINAGLQRKDKELLAVAASLAAGCIPCTRHHAVAVRDAGASEAEVGWAAAVGIAVKRRSLAIMGALAAELLSLPDSASDRARESAGGESQLAPLVTLAAAVAAHCAPAVEESITRAQELGWTEQDIRRTLGVGRMVRETGARKADEAAGQLLSQTNEDEAREESR